MINGQPYEVIITVIFIVIIMGVGAIVVLIIGSLISFIFSRDEKEIAEETKRYANRYKLTRISYEVVTVKTWGELEAQYGLTFFKRSIKTEPKFTKKLEENITENRKIKITVWKYPDGIEEASYTWTYWFFTKNFDFPLCAASSRNEINVIKEIGSREIDRF